MFPYLLASSSLQYVAISRDTLEGDIKQRREIRDATAYYIDQCAVRAAINGRILILDGIEKVNMGLFSLLTSKAERNVLPILNNLLENREMHLEDGRFLVSPARYDSLASSHSPADIEKWRLVRVHERFRVIALGLPVPRYPGHPLDPPLRSRFQARLVQPELFMERLLHGVPHASTIASHAGALRLLDTPGSSPPVITEDLLARVAAQLKAAPALPVSRALQTICPHIFFQEQIRNTVERSLTKFSITPEPQPYVPRNVVVAPTHAVVTLEAEDVASAHFDVPAGGHAPTASHCVPTATHAHVLADMLLAHTAGDICLVGPRGCGKSVVAEEFARTLHYACVHVLLHKDMSSRDLLQQRFTLANGDTAWRVSALVQAAVDGQ